jgi:phosphoribosylamine--glycine ligase
MNVLILGSGGREHALGWKIAQSPLCKTLFFAPGNPGTAEIGENVTINTIDEIISFCRDKNINLVLPGPEAWLIKGITDELEQAGIPVFGPGKEAALLEGSKAFAKEIMVKANVPTADFREFNRADKALAHVNHAAFPLVIKADGLAAGKGVTICHDREDAIQAITQCMIDKKFGSSGDKIIVEDFLTGTEASFHLVCDGVRAVPLVSAQDHKALFDGNKGPNTGGMGTFAPSPRVTSGMEQTIIDEIANPVLKVMREEGTPFKGVLFIGLMLTYHGPRVLEFNVRFGDPETQVMMPLIKDDLLELLYSAAQGSLKKTKIETIPGSSVCVVLSSKGYPEKPETGKIIEMPDLADSGCGEIIFHAGTRRNEAGQLLSSGGRVLGVTAWDRNIEKAREHAYETVKHVHFEGAYYRNDIGGIL